PGSRRCRVRVRVGAVDAAAYPDRVIVTAPASSANLGPGFDCLGLALDLPFGLSADEHPEDWLAAEPTHPAAIAFVAAGGDPDAALWWRSPIPPGRGLGFSGAARVAGAYLASRRTGAAHDTARTRAFQVATELEGHPDNAAASAFGGFTVAAGTTARSLAMPEGVSIVVWSPERSTSTDASRRVLADDVVLADAAWSLARSSLWVAAVATGDLSVLRVACEDRLHQPSRLAARPDAASTLDAFLASEGVLAAWLSGSGPTVAALVSAGSAEQLADGLAQSDGRTRVLDVAAAGVRESADGTPST
ncbi:MAG: hypothetical protein M3Y51_10420, partial [Actinomycetota bacterium]|nr:hypothetical protein [Actinomycetota bacterium]